MILYVGATGLLGSQTVCELVRRGKNVRCLVREPSDTSRLPESGIELVRGDVRDPASLKAAVNGTEVIISSFATNIAKDHNVSNLWKCDYEGNLSLIKLAREAGVKKFIFVSYWGLAKFGGFEHGKIKKMVEDLISVSGIDYTVLRVTSLATDMSLLLGKTLQKKGRSPVLMKKTERIRPILIEDLAWCIADTIENTQASNKIIEVAGEEEYTFLELQELFCKTIGRQVRFIFVPTPLGYAVASCIDFITAQKYNARGLVSAFTGGSTCDITEMQKTFKLKQGSFARHLEDYFKTGGIVPQNPKPLS